MHCAHTQGSGERALPQESIEASVAPVQQHLTTAPTQHVGMQHNGPRYAPSFLESSVAGAAKKAAIPGMDDCDTTSMASM